MKFMRLLIIIFPLIILGCGKAEISFVSNAESNSRVNVENRKWSVALSKDDIVKIETSQDIEYNSANATNKVLTKSLLFDLVKVGEERTVKIKPGVYDWLVVMDDNGSGRVNSYVGTRTDNIKLSKYDFLDGYRYRIIINNENNVEISSTKM